MMLNNVIGAGILSLPGLAAGIAGIQSFWTWIIASLVVAPLLTVFMMLAINYPNAGGAIHVAQQAFGRFGSLFTSTLLFGTFILGIPSVALTGGYYLQGAFSLPAWSAGALMLITATLANLFSAKGAARIGIYASIAVIGFLIILISAGLFSVHLTINTSIPFPKWSAFSPFMLVFFAFSGWEVSLGLSEEFTNPRRNIPIAIASSWLVISIFYIFCALIVTNGGKNFWNAHPFLDVFTKFLGNKTQAETIVAIGATLLIWTNLFAAVWGISRMIYRSIKFKQLSYERRGIPVAAVTVTGGIMTSVVLLSAALSINISTLLSSAGMNFLILYGIAAAALCKLSQGILPKIIALGAIIPVALLMAYSTAHLIYPALIFCVTLMVFISHTRHAKKATL